MNLDFTSIKGWWQSKTIWTGIVGAIFAALGLLGLVPQGLDAATVVNAVLGVVSVGAIIFRVQANTKIG